MVLPSIPFATYKRHSTGLSGGTTASTYGTAVTEVIPTWAKGILGVAVVGVDETTTAAEGKSSLMRINIKSLGISNSVYSVGPYVTSGPATNNDGQPDVIEFLPLDIACKGGEEISLDFAPAGTSTGAVLYEVSWLLTNDPLNLPKTFKLGAMFGKHLPFRDGNVSNAAQTTTTRTSLTAIKADPIEAICGVKGIITKTGAITTAEEGIGIFEFDTSLVPELVIPTCFATGAALGTPAGGHGQYGLNVPYLPCWIPASGKSETITPYITLRTAVSTGNRVAAGIGWR